MGIVSFEKGKRMVNEDRAKREFSLAGDKFMNEDAKALDVALAAMQCMEYAAEGAAEPTYDFEERHKEFYAFLPKEPMSAIAYISRQMGAILSLITSGKREAVYDFCEFLHRDMEPAMNCLMEDVNIQSIWYPGAADEPDDLWGEVEDILGGLEELVDKKEDEELLNRLARLFYLEGYILGNMEEL